MAGCLKNSLAGIGCLTVLAVGGILGWRYRDQLVGFYRSVRGAETVAPPPAVEIRPEAGSAALAPAGPTPPSRPAERSAATAPQAPNGRPSPAALQSARRKEDAMGRSNGPATVRLSAAEMASLIEDGLDPTGRRALDSLEVVLHTGRLELRAALVTQILSGYLGPFAALFQERERMRASGPARVARTGVVAWQPDSFVVRAFPFPSGFVPPLVDRLTGSQGGVVPIAVPPTVGDVRITPDGVTFYRREDR